MELKIDAEDFTHTVDGLETVCHIKMGLIVNLIFDEVPSKEELLHAAMENFRDHPALESVDEFRNSVGSIVLEAPANNTCEACNGNRYLICTRDDGRRAVERCDTCSTEIDDMQAADLAIRDGIDCVLTYPCYLTEAFQKSQGGRK